MDQARVLDVAGHPLSPCSVERARDLVASGRAVVVSQTPLTIRLGYAVEVPEPERTPPPSLKGQRLLLHVCCGPCATWTLKHLADLGAAVTGFWYNPNIHPYSEHERRRHALQAYAEEQAVAMVWGTSYAMVPFLQVVAGAPQRPERCRLCYRMRLRHTAQRAAELGCDAFTTTLLISPYQSLGMIREEGCEAARQYGVRFYGENLRRGFAAHHRLAKEHGLYRQRYCGCIYSEWEALDRDATTRTEG